MVQAFRNAMSRRGERSRQTLLLRLEGELDGIYDLIFQTCGDETHAVQVLQKVLRVAMSRSHRERYERYLRLWALGITVECIRTCYPRFLAEKDAAHSLPFPFLSLDEKLVLFLRERTQLSPGEIASVTRIPPGRAGRSLVYAREKLARQELGLAWEEGFPLRERMAWNQGQPEPGVPADYARAITEAQVAVSCLTGRRFAEIESSVRHQKLLPLLGRAAERPRWKDFSWQAKLGIEAACLGAVGLFAVLVVPWVLANINTSAFLEGRFAELFQVERQQATVQAEAITTDRLLAVNDALEERQQENDEFADMEFPSGDGVELGSAPLAPSRQNATVYRLIVQSPAPQDLIPQVRTLFAEKQVRERESSGRIMPGGVYFDGITSVGAYPQILQEMQKLGQTKTYTNGGSRNPQERARVIVWVQQI